MSSISIDLGSGPNPRNNFNATEVIGFDTFNQDSPKVIKHDLMKGTIPLEDNSVDFVTAFDFLEHVDRVGYRLTDGDIERFFPFIDIMSEIWRVLKPGGQLYAFTPVYPNKEAFRDPQHVNIVTDDMWEYFAGSMLGLTQHYGFKGEFKLLEQRFEGAHVVWHMEAIK
jgi:SAM-dependent methyltransferase